MSKITVKFLRSDGRSMIIDDITMLLMSAEGLDSPTVEVFSEKLAIGDGDLITGTRVGSREIEFKAKVKYASLNDTLRRAWTSFFTVRHTYDVYVTRTSPARYAPECQLDSFKIPTENCGEPIEINVTLICPGGYWLSVDSFGKNIAGVEARAGWPWIAQSGYGRIYGIYSYAGTVYIDNDGDADAYCQAVFVAQGDVTNPKLISGDGYVRVLTSMAEGDVLIIDGKSKSVTLNGVNAATLLDKGSSFDGIVFGIGTNTIAFTADVGSNVVAVNVYYNKRYMGA